MRIPETDEKVRVSVCVCVCVCVWRFLFPKSNKVWCDS